MADSLRFEVAGLDRLNQRLAAMGPRVVQAAGQALREEAELIMGDSKENYVPVDLGPLRASGHVGKVEHTGPHVDVTMGFGGPSAKYAWRVHENPRAGKTGGTSPTGRRYKHWAKVGGWKYLETPFLAASQQVTAHVAASVRQILARP